MCVCVPVQYVCMDEKMPPWLCWKQDLVTVWLHWDSQHKLSAIFYTLIWEAFGPGLQRNRMQFHQTARNSAVVSTAAKSHQHAAVQRNRSRLRDVCMRYSVWLPSQGNIWERERNRHTAHRGCKHSDSSSQNWCYGCRGKGNALKENKLKRGPAFGVPSPLHTLPLYAILYGSTLICRAPTPSSHT